MALSRSARGSPPPTIGMRALTRSVRRERHLVP